ncbi:MAG: TorF family putative porin [Glaciecola sp.]
MKQLTKLSLVAVALSSTLFVSQAALAEVSANIGATSNYVWRGVSQSSNAASVSGGLDYSDESGFYAGTWVGSLGDDASGFNGSETDFYLGFGGETDSFAYDVGYIYYAYTELDDSNFGEVYFNGSVGNFGFGLAYTINSDLPSGAGFETGDIFYSLSYGGIDLGSEFELGLSAGLYTFDSDGVDGADYDYSYVQADISKGDFTFSVSKAQESDFADEDIKFVASWSTSF